MRIGINASFLQKPGTGIGQVTLYFLKTLAKTPAGKEHEYFLYLDQDVDISFLPPNFKKKVFLPFWKRDDVPRKWLWEKFSIPKQAKKDKLKKFLSLYQSATIMPENIPHIMVVHDLIPRFFPEYRANIRQKLHWKSIETALKHVTHIISVSESTANDLVEFGIERKSITVAYPDCAPLFREEVSEEEKIHVRVKYSVEEGYIYHGGGLEIRKNTELLLRAYGELVEKERRFLLDVKLPQLIISGKIFPTTNKLATSVEELVVELGLEGRVRFLGFVEDEDLPTLYKNALFFVYPSLYEGFGLPVLEALRMHTPILAADGSSLPEVAGDAALYIDPYKKESLVSGMERLLRDENLRKSLSEKSSAQTMKFSWDTFTEAITRSLEKN